MAARKFCAFHTLFGQPGSATHRCADGAFYLVAIGREHTHTATRKIYGYYFLSDRCSLTCTRLTADCGTFAGTGIVFFLFVRDPRRTFGP